MILNISILSIAEMFERFSYYGVRSILILFLFSRLGWERVDSSEFYGSFTLAVYIATVIGGLLADLSRRPVLIAIIGNALSTAGIFMLSAAESPITVYAAAGAMALGTGLWKPSVIAALYRVSFTHKHRFDLIFTIFYCAINIGAFAAPIVIGGVADSGDTPDYRLGLMVAGCISLVPAILLAATYNNLISNDLLYNNQTYRSSDIGVTSIVLLFFLSIIFWLTYELVPAYIDSDHRSSATILVAGVGLVMYMVMIPIHLIRNFRSAVKICIGVLIVALVSIVYPLLQLPAFSGLILLTVAEALIIPVLWSQIVQHVSPRFTALVMSLLMFSTLGINKVTGLLYDATETEQPVILYILATVCLAMVGAFLALDHAIKKREQNFQPPLY